MFTISKTFEFSASHKLEGLSPEHPCSRLHGHNYSVTLTLRSNTLNAVGFVRDYRELGVIKQDLDEALDHRHLNDVFDFNPTAELIAKRLFDEYINLIPELINVTVKETDRTSATYEP
jgi:6-pyruvoyltetrahydropterin/6-carboxytetrahydropterin synthase